MPILDAALAFALTMLLVATIVTHIVYLVQRLTQKRSGEFAKMLHQFYGQELGPVVQREMHRLSSKVDAAVTADIEKAAAELKITDLVPKDKELGQMTELANIELEEMLKRSTLGEKLLKGLGDHAEDVFTELCKRYDAVGQKYTESFRRDSRWWATGVALVLAFAVNIDSLFIASSYLDDEGSRGAVIAQYGAIVEGVEELRSGVASGASAPVTTRDLQSVIDESRRRISVLQGDGFPVGWGFFPQALWLHDKDPRAEARNNRNGWITWALGLLLTAFCAGLGAPFWYDTVTGIARAVQRESNTNEG